MTRPPLAHTVLGLALAASAALAWALTPREPPAAANPGFVLEEMIPREFGDWSLEAADNVLVVNPQQEELIGRLYQQTLSRTYRLQGSEARVMLSIAYGGAQSDTLRVHRPERCYYAQGFAVGPARVGTLDTPWGALPVRRLEARAGWRHEPVTYWVTMGRRPVVAGSVEEKLTQVRYGLFGKVPDGILVRVSSLGADPDRAYALQEDFVNELLGTLGTEQRIRLTGDLSQPKPAEAG